MRSACHQLFASLQIAPLSLKYIRPSGPASIEKMPSELVNTTLCEATPPRLSVRCSCRICPVLYALKKSVPFCWAPRPQWSQNTRPVGAIVGV